VPISQSGHVAAKTRFDFIPWEICQRDMCVGRPSRSSAAPWRSGSARGSYHRISIDLGVSTLVFAVVFHRMMPPRGRWIETNRCYLFCVVPDHPEAVRSSRSQRNASKRRFCRFLAAFDPFLASHWRKVGHVIILPAAITKTEDERRSLH
jgi:hypothetical protein